MAYPVFVDGTSLAAVYAKKGEDFGDHGELKDINRREELTKLVLASREFDRAIVNLRCVDGLDDDALAVTKYDGASF